LFSNERQGIENTEVLGSLVLRLVDPAEDRRNGAQGPARQSCASMKNRTREVLMTEKFGIPRRDRPSARRRISKSHGYQRHFSLTKVLLWG